MNRRTALTLLAGLPLADTATRHVSASGPRTTYGFLDVQGHRAHQQLTGEDLHVWVDGVDVSADCFEADDLHGYVGLFCRDQQAHADWTAKGAKHLRGNGVCRLRVEGRVVIAPGPHA